MYLQEFDSTEIERKIMKLNIPNPLSRIIQPFTFPEINNLTSSENLIISLFETFLLFLVLVEKRFVILEKVK